MKKLKSILVSFLLVMSAFVSAEESLLKQKPYDLMFIDEMTVHHKEGVEMAKIALEKAYHEEIKTMSAKMIKAQRKEIDKLQSWRKAWYPKAKPFKSYSVGIDMEKLSSRDGVIFDVSFIDSMNMHHMGAIFMGQEAQTRGKHLLLKQLALKIVEDQSKELNKMREMRDNFLETH